MAATRVIQWSEEDVKRQSYNARNQMATVRSGCEALLSDPRCSDTTKMIVGHMMGAVQCLEELCREFTG